MTSKNRAHLTSFTFFKRRVRYHDPYVPTFRDEGLDVHSVSDLREALSALIPRPLSRERSSL